MPETYGWGVVLRSWQVARVLMGCCDGNTTGLLSGVMKPTWESVRDDPAAGKLSARIRRICCALQTTVCAFGLTSDVCARSEKTLPGGRVLLGWRHNADVGLWAQATTDESAERR